MADKNCYEPRFAIVSDDFIDNLINTSIPEKTKKATKYGMKIFNGKDISKVVKKYLEITEKK